MDFLSLTIFLPLVGVVMMWRTGISTLPREDWIPEQPGSDEGKFPSHIVTSSSHPRILCGAGLAAIV